MFGRAGGGIMHQVERDDIGRLGDPVGIAHGLGEFIDQRGVLAQQFGDFLLLVGHFLFAPVAHVAKPQPFA